MEIKTFYTLKNILSKINDDTLSWILDFTKNNNYFYTKATFENFRTKLGYIKSLIALMHLKKSCLKLL